MAWGPSWYPVELSGPGARRLFRGGNEDPHSPANCEGSLCVAAPSLFKIPNPSSIEPSPECATSPPAPLLIISLQNKRAL